MRRNCNYPVPQPAGFSGYWPPHNADARFDAVLPGCDDWGQSAHYAKLSFNPQPSGSGVYHEGPQMYSGAMTPIPPHPAQFSNNASSYNAQCASTPPPHRVHNANRGSHSDPAVGGSKGLDQDPVYMVVQLGKRKFPALLDSGCEKTLAPLRVVNTMRSAYIFETSYQLTCANGSALTIVGETILPLNIEGKVELVSALVSPDVDEIMIGVEWLRKRHAIWNFGNGRIYLEGGQPITLTTCKSADCRRVYVQQNVLIPSRQEVNVPARTVVRAASVPELELRAIEPRSLGGGMYVARTLLAKGLHDLNVRVVNTAPQPQWLDADRCLGESTPVEIVDPNE